MPGSGAPTATPSPLAGSPPGRWLCWSGCAGTARLSGLGVAEGQGESSPGRAGAPTNRRPGKPGGEAASQPARPRGSGRRKFVGAPRGDGWSGYGCPGCHPGADEAHPGAAGAGVPGGWAAAVGSCPPPKGQRGAHAAVPRPSAQRRSSQAGFFPAMRSEGCGSRVCPRRRQLSGSGNSVPPPQPSWFSSPRCHRGARAAEDDGMQRRLG